MNTVAIQVNAENQHQYSDVIEMFILVEEIKKNMMIMNQHWVNWGDLDDHKINFNDDLPRSKAYLPKQGIRKQLKQKIIAYLKRGCPKPFPNLFQIRHILELGICTFGPKFSWAHLVQFWVSPIKQRNSNGRLLSQNCKTNIGQIKTLLF